MRFARLAVCSTLAVFSAGLPGASAADSVLTLAYLNRPGFAEMKDGKPAGAFLPAAYAAATASGLKVEFQALPQKRLLEQVKQDTPDYCAVGIYRTPEREAWAKFSAAFYRDKKFAVATSTAKVNEVKAHGSAFKLFENESLKLGAVDGFSYGNAVDARIKKMGSNLDLAVVTADKIVAKLAAGRIDYMLAAPEEFEVLVKAADADRNSLALVEFNDMPDGTERHFMCSKSVSDDVLAKLSEAVKKTASTN